MSSPLDAVSTLERQGHFVQALTTVQTLLTGDAPCLSQAALALTGGRCALKQGGLQGYHTAVGYFDHARALYEQLAQWDMVAVVMAEKAMGAIHCGVTHALQTA